MFIELHIIQSFPPSNLNRDDIGQPKDCDFGGVRRARISSQCQKRAIRYAGKDPKDETSQSLFERYTQVPLGMRTHLIVSALRKRIVAAGKTEDDATKVAVEFARVYSSKKGKMNAKKPEETPVLLYMSEQELDEVTRQLLALKWTELLSAIEATKPNKPKKGSKEEKGEDDEKATAKSPLKKMADDWAKQTKERPSAPDIALFGRMLADRPETNIDAACQVAHAISTHAIGKMELDYFTAMDDLKDKHDPGAGYLDVAYFTTACFYRYARIDWTQLNVNLKDKELAVKTVAGFLRAAEAAIPSGKQNSHAQQARPSFMLAVLRDKNSAGWSLVNAFEKPVHPPTEAGLIEESVKRLDAHFKHLRDFYGDDTVKAVAVALPDGSVTPDLLSEKLRASVRTMNDWVAAICDPLRQGA